MNLDDAQKQRVSQWIEEGLKLSEIQDKLAAEEGIKLTYMEVRFLIDDLGVKLKDKPRRANSFWRATWNSMRSSWEGL